MICILGCLDNENGLKICNEMLKWIKPEHDVYVVHQEPPGKEFEYPAILRVLNCSIQLNQPILYLHTKGAGNPIPIGYKDYMMNPVINFPKEAKPEDCQKIVRNMWQHEFTGERLKEYLKIIDTDKPTVVCPLTGKEKITWQNGWIINPAGAKELLKTFHKDSNRYYYENMFRKTNINVIGIISNNCNANVKNHKTLWDIMWKFYKND